MYWWLHWVASKYYKATNELLKHPDYQGCYKQVQQVVWRETESLVQTMDAVFDEICVDWKFSLRFRYALLDHVTEVFYSCAITYSYERNNVLTMNHGNLMQITEGYFSFLYLLCKGKTKTPSICLAQKISFFSSIHETLFHWLFMGFLADIEASRRKICPMFCILYVVNGFLDDNWKVKSALINDTSVSMNGSLLKNKTGYLFRFHLFIYFEKLSKTSTTTYLFLKPFEYNNEFF
jgi:hypothetical protein